VLLGPLPDRLHRGKDADGRKARFEDPRLGPLPSGWRVRNEGGTFEAKDGRINPSNFENRVSGEKTWADLRLTRDALNERGVEIREAALI